MYRQQVNSLLDMHNNCCQRFHRLNFLVTLQNKLDPTPKLLVKFDPDTGEVVRDKNGFCTQVGIGMYMYFTICFLSKTNITTYTCYCCLICLPVYKQHSRYLLLNLSSVFQIFIIMAKRLKTTSFNC